MTGGGDDIFRCPNDVSECKRELACCDAAMSLGVKCAVLTFCQPLSVYPSEADIVPLLPYVCFAPKGDLRENGLLSVFSPRYCCASKRRRRLPALGCLAAHSRVC